MSWKNNLDSIITNNYNKLKRITL